VTVASGTHDGQPAIGATATEQSAVPVVILNWNGLKDTQQCVDHLLASRGVSFRVILVDNGSDGDDYARLQARYGDHRLIDLRCNSENLGFARGMNQVLAELLAAGGASPYVVLLNNDAFPEPEWLAALVEAAERTGAGAVASCMLRHDDPDRLDNAGHVFLNTGEVLPRGAGEPPGQHASEVAVEGVCGGACLIRLQMLEDIGLFDPFYSTGYEDAELGLRALLAGHTQVYQPRARARHRIGASIDKVRDREYAVRLQVNINYAYFKLMPWSVIAWNAPWLAIKTVALLCVPAVTGRWKLLAVQWRALRETLRCAPVIATARRQRPARRIAALEIIRCQEFFLKRYWQYFRRFVLARQPTIFERWQ